MSLSTATASGFKSFTRTSPQLYRDCLRLVNHIAGRSAKGEKLRKILHSEFRKNANVEDPIKVESLKSNAVRGLANYLMITSTAKDPKLQQFANSYAEKEIKEANASLEQSRSDVTAPAEKYL
jgi:hypothetical protein